MTFLFTDIEGSTRLLQQLGEGYRETQERHDGILRASIDEADDYVVRTEGDSFFATFTSAVPESPRGGGAYQQRGERDHAS